MKGRTRMVACVACGRVIAMRKSGHPYRHKPITRANKSRFAPERATYCDGVNYPGDPA